MFAVDGVFCTNFFWSVRPHATLTSTTCCVARSRSDHNLEQKSGVAVARITDGDQGVVTLDGAVSKIFK